MQAVAEVLLITHKVVVQVLEELEAAQRVVDQVLDLQRHQQTLVEALVVEAILVEVVAQVDQVLLL
jgi:hypothetical protein